MATRGLVSLNQDFIRGAFGETLEDFLEILSMPDRYLIYRQHYANDGAADWKRMFCRLGSGRRELLLERLQELNAEPRRRPELLARVGPPLRPILEHYYPGGHTAPRTREEDTWAQQGVSVGYDSGPG
jgi:hypothetical protein